MMRSQQTKELLLCLLIMCGCVGCSAMSVSGKFRRLNANEQENYKTKIAEIESRKSAAIDVDSLSNSKRLKSALIACAGQQKCIELAKNEFISGLKSNYSEVNFKDLFVK